MFRPKYPEEVRRVLRSTNAYRKGDSNDIRSICLVDLRFFNFYVSSVSIQAPHIDTVP